MTSITASVAERVEVLALLGIPHRAVCCKFDREEIPCFFTRKTLIKIIYNANHGEPTISLGFSQYSFLANPCKINLVYYYIISSV